jgi:hypothetical protein
MLVIWLSMSVSVASGLLSSRLLHWVITLVGQTLDGSDFTAFIHG